MSTTALVVFIAIIAVGIYDLAIIVIKGRASTVSDFVLKTTKISPVFTFVMGCIVGHLFFNMCGAGF